MMSPWGEQMTRRLKRSTGTDGTKGRSRPPIGVILALLSVASLLVFVATVVLWAYSRSGCHFYHWGNAGREFELDSGGGLIELTYAADTSLVNPLCGWKIAHNDSPNSLWTGVTPGPRRAGFAFYVLRTVGRPAGNWRIGGRRLFLVFFPHWSVALLASCLPLYCVFRLTVGRKRRREGHCVHCGYNLTGNLSGVCPECGEKT